MSKHYKFYPTQITSIDEENYRLWVRFTDDTEDRQGEIVDGDTWNFKDWMKAPSVLFGHNDTDYRMVIGKGLEIREVEETSDDGTRIKAHEALVEIDSGDEDSLRIWGKIKRGFIKTASVGFRSAKQQGNRLMDNLLTEISFVPVPANINATVKSLEDGSLSKDDVTYFRNQAIKTVEVFDKFLEKEKTMTDEELEQLSVKLSEKLEAKISELGDDLKEVQNKISAFEVDKQSSENDGGTATEEHISDEEAEILLEKVDELLASSSETKEEEND